MGATMSQMKDFGRSWLPGYSSHLNPNQQRINRHFQIAVVTSAAWCYLGYKYAPIKVPSLPTVTDRLVYTLQWQVPSVAMMAAGIFEVGGTRWRTEAIDPLKGCENQQDKDRFQVHLNYLNNTKEQLIYSMTSQLILTSFLDQSEMKIIPVLVTLFVTGRILFWLGYLRRPTDRVVGFGMTFIPNTILFLCCCYHFGKRILTDTFRKTPMDYLRSLLR